MTGPSAPRAVVIPARPDWEGRAADLVSTLASALGHGATRIEHIGSTAIPAMPAKDVIDLQVSVGDLDETDRSFDVPLTALGFRSSPYRFDHVPAGRSDDPIQWAKRLWIRRGEPGGDVNLHVRRVGSPNERLALLFRDWFRSHPEAVPAYGQFKHALADVAPDIGVYTEVKDPVVDLVIAVAEQWATASGWVP